METKKIDEENKLEISSETSKDSRWSAVKKYIKYLFVDFFTSFKYNKMKLAGWLVAIPGIFLGFFLTFHIPVVNAFAFTGTVTSSTGALITRTYFPDISGIILFILVLFGILNLFTAFNMMSKKNLGSVVTATITTVVILVVGAIYLYMIFLFASLVANGSVKLSNNQTFTWSTNYIMSVGSVVISMIASVVGVILGFIFRDKNYKKVKF